MRGSYLIIVTPTIFAPVVSERDERT